MTKLAWWCIALFISAGNAFAQAGESRWQLNGIPITFVPNYQLLPQIVNDGEGGAIIVWQDERGGEVNRQYWDIYAQRVDSNGVILWQENGIPVSALPEYQAYPLIIADGEGGAIIAWPDWRGYFEGKVVDVYAQKLRMDGVALWEPNGLGVTTERGEQGDINLISDGHGGAIFAWYDGRRPWPEDDIYAQRVSREGKRLWQEGGVPVCTAPSFQDLPYAIPDGRGGMILNWYDQRQGRETYAQRLNAMGVPQWTENGVLIGTLSGVLSHGGIVSDGQSGAIIDWSAPDGIRVQRLDSLGQKRWGENGILVFPPGEGGFIDSYPKLASNNKGGAIVLANMNEWNGGGVKPVGYYAQAIDHEGTFIWHDAVRASPLEYYDGNEVEVCSDGFGGVLAVFPCSRSRENYNDWGDIAVQRVDSSGVLVWGEKPIIVCINQRSSPQQPCIVSDTKGGAYVAWIDMRRGFEADTTMGGDIYMQRVYADGRVGGDTTSLVTQRPLFSMPEAYVLNQNFPNPFNEQTVIGYTIPPYPHDQKGTPDRTVCLTVYNLLGKEVKTLIDDVQEAGYHEAIWDGTDAGGKSMPSGVYFVGFSGAERDTWRKMLLLR